MEIRAGASALVLLCAALAGCAPALDWRELSVPEGKFSALLPCKPRHETRTFSTAAGMLTMTMYACGLKRGTMAVTYTDYPVAALAAGGAREQIDAARDALLRNIGAGSHAEEEVAIAGLPGRQVYAEGRAGAQGARLKVRFVVAGNRLYQIAYVGERDGPAMADIDLFLTSFKLLPLLLAPKSGREHHQQGEQLQPSEQHGEGEDPDLEIIHRRISRGRPHLTQARAGIVDAGDNRRKCGNDVQAGGGEQHGHCDE